MGQTLTHGIYLPDEGERNCYDGLAGNWQLLDGAVGTVAEHTTALAGKAPAVHTHTKADITDFPVYGNTAGTICEGNDSRLSDARTPVAHTHLTADVTDLLNSAHTWTGENTFIGLTALATTAEGRELLHNTWHGYEQYYTRGTSNYPNYDTFLKWDSSKYDNTLGLFRSAGVLNSTTEGATVNDIDKTFAYYIYHINAKYVDFMNNVRIVNNGTSDILAPISNGTTDLGSSTNKWKTLNGINPGALSLPVTALNNTYDISGNITDLTGGNNAITAARTGWIFVKSDNATEISIENTTTGMGASDHSASATTLMVSIPVTSGETLNIIANCTSIDKAYLLPCQGNV